MMRMRRKASPAFVPMKEISADNEEDFEWEVRPCGMLVQKRNPDTPTAGSGVVATIRVRVKFGSARHEVLIGSQATFGELKKLLSDQTGLHPQDQKLVFRGMERDSSAYLDIAGVKDGSKMVLLEDPDGQARRILDMRRAAKQDKASKSVTQIKVEVDHLASRVSALEAVISKGEKVEKKDVEDLIELLMTQLVKLDSIVADGDVKLQRTMQERRVQKCVEKLDALKIQNAKLTTVAGVQTPVQQQQQQRRSSVVVTTKWETFDSIFSPTTSNASTTSSSTAASISRPIPRIDWGLL